MNFDTLASEESLSRTQAALQSNGFSVFVVENGAQAKAKVLEIIPQGAEVMTMTSVTMDTIGATQELVESGKYDAVKKKLMTMDRATQGAEMQKLGAAPEWATGSVHAITESGALMWASLTGSQMPAFAYGARHVVLVAGTHKIVADAATGMKRIYERCLPLESERAKKAYGVQGSNVNKLLTVERELTTGRITVILVKEVLGF